MNWILQEQWITHVDAVYSYHINHITGGKFIAVLYERVAISPAIQEVGQFDTLEEAQAVCENSYASRMAAK